MIGGELLLRGLAVAFVVFLTAGAIAFLVMSLKPKFTDEEIKAIGGTRWFILVALFVVLAMLLGSYITG